MTLLNSKTLPGNGDTTTTIIENDTTHKVLMPNDDNLKEKNHELNVLSSVSEEATVIKSKKPGDEENKSIKQARLKAMNERRKLEAQIKELVAQLRGKRKKQRKNPLWRKKFVEDMKIAGYEMIYSDDESPAQPDNVGCSGAEEDL